MHYFATCLVPLEELTLKKVHIHKFQPPDSINDTKSCEIYVFDLAIKILWRTLMQRTGENDSDIIKNWSRSLKFSIAEFYITMNCVRLFKMMK